MRSACLRLLISSAAAQRPVQAEEDTAQGGLAQQVEASLSVPLSLSLSLAVSPSVPPRSLWLSLSESRLSAPPPLCGGRVSSLWPLQSRCRISHEHVHHSSSIALAGAHRRGRSVVRVDGDSRPSPPSSSSPSSSLSPQPRRQGDCEQQQQRRQPHSQCATTSKPPRVGAPN
jgi:hypothetical protein